MSSDAGDGLVFEPGSFDEGAGELGSAADDLDSSVGDSAVVQGQAGAQLRQWLPTAPAADAIDEVEATADRALSEATSVTREDADKLLTAKQNMLDTEARNTALADQIGRGDAILPATSGDAETPSDVTRALSGDPATATFPDDSESYAAHVDQQIQDRIDELRNDGPGSHGPQRHLDVTDTQLQQRLGTAVLNPDGTPQLRADGFAKTTGQIDPMTGTTRDATTSLEHRCGKFATRFDSAADYAHADSVLRAHADASGFGRQTMEIEPLLGSDAYNRMTGYYSDPINVGRFLRVNFQGGSITAIYYYDEFGAPHLYTMYPEPAPGIHP